MVICDEASMIPLAEIALAIYNFLNTPILIAGDPMQIKPILSEEEWKNENVQAQNLVVDGLYTYTNAKSTTPVNYYEKKRLVGLYGDISLGYKDMLFINVTGRNDWSSTLPINNRSYFYPSISGSFILTELMENKEILNYGKISLSYEYVGSDEDP